MYPNMPAGSEDSILPSRTTMRMGSPQSRQGASMVMVFPGKSQQTASDSKPHWPYQPGFPSTEMRYWVG